MTERIQLAQEFVAAFRYLAECFGDALRALLDPRVQAARKRYVLAV